MSGTDSIPGDLPAGLARALADREATVAWRRREGPRTYLRVESAAGELFAWFTTSANEAAMVAREAAFREQVGTTGILRAPPLLDFGTNWRIEPFVRSGPWHGPDAIEDAVAAAQEIARLTLPEAAPPPAELSAAVTLRRRLRVLASPLSVRDVAGARRALAACRLPQRTSHGEYHPLHLFHADRAVWVIDWDLAGTRPAGFDLMQLWVALDDPEDRGLLYDAAASALGDERELAKVRYAVLVRTIAAAFSEVVSINRDPDRGRELLALLPAARRAAGV